MTQRAWEILGMAPLAVLMAAFYVVAGRIGQVRRNEDPVLFWAAMIGLIAVAIISVVYALSGRA